MYYERPNNINITVFVEIRSTFTFYFISIIFVFIRNAYILRYDIVPLSHAGTCSSD